MSKEDLNQLLKRLSKERSYGAYTAVENSLAKITPELSSMPVLKIAILRNFILDPVIPVIKGEVALCGFYPRIYLGDYDTIAQDVLNPNSELYKFKPDLIIMAQWLEVLAPALVNRFPALSAEQVNIELNRVLNTVTDFIVALRQHTNVPILVNNFSLPSDSAHGILDTQSENYQSHTIISLNLKLLHCLKPMRSVFLVDYLNLMAKVGSWQGIDERYWQIGRAPIGRNALVPFGQEYGKFIRALHGKNRKCLVLDCDNILWGGIVGEEGLRGIQLGTSYPGSCYQAFQHEILNLHDRGVILALCSKNNEADVLEVLRTHPEMLLHEENLSTWQINWDDKATNLRRIAQDLNIGLDSLVFVDDNQFECDLVREQLPAVAVLQLSSDPSSYRAKLNSLGYFDNLIFSSEDKERNRMYRDQTKRKELAAIVSSLEEYYMKLEMKAEINKADEISIQRIAQLTQKTNQFNLTTRRYTEGDIRAFAKNPEIDVFCLRLQDRISEMGLIGVAVIKYYKEKAEIDTFLLSCRAIGRGVEETLMAHILNAAQARGCKYILGHYLITNKNEQVADFYDRQGFNKIKETAQGCDWELLFGDQTFIGPSWIKIIQSEEEKKACQLMNKN